VAPRPLLLVLLLLALVAPAPALAQPTAGALPWWLTGTAAPADATGEAGEGVDAASVWPRSEGEGVVVAVIDSGVDRYHPALRDAVTGSYDFGPEQSPDRDVVSHGTHVAGTIAGRSVGGVTIGVAPRARLVSLKVEEGGQLSRPALVRALRFAADQPEIKVVNLSLGTDNDFPTVRAAVQLVLRRGKVVVAAAGNAGMSLDDQIRTYPCLYYGVICVSASSRSGQLAYWSNYGFDRVAFSAPGTEITSSLPGGGYAAYSGTSMAAPIVSGVAALLWAAHPEATAHQVRLALVAGVKWIRDPDGMILTRGVLDAPRALAELDRLRARPPAVVQPAA
jgi:subtilisin family serine protease